MTYYNPTEQQISDEKKIASIRIKYYSENK